MTLIITIINTTVTVTLIITIINATVTVTLIVEMSSDVNVEDVIADVLTFSGKCNKIKKVK